MITLTTKSHVTVYYFLTALPGLHISPGAFHNFLKTLKDKCSVLDIKIA